MNYLRRTTGVPTTYHRIQNGDALRIGARTFQVMTGGGHALEQAMLYRPQERLFFAADQVIARISPNVSVHAMEPDLDALGIYLRSLSGLRDAVASDVLVLPGHGLPFHGLHERVGELMEHHEQRCGAIAEACRQQPLSVADIVPHVFHRELDEHQTGFAFGEVLAHVNHMLGRDQLVLETGQRRHRPLSPALSITRQDLFSPAMACYAAPNTKGRQRNAADQDRRHHHRRGGRARRPMAAATGFLPGLRRGDFQRHLPVMEPEVFDAASGRMCITYQTFVVRSPRHTILVDTCTGEDKGHPRAVRFPRQGALAE